MLIEYNTHLLKVCGGEWGVAILSWGVAILKSDFSVSVCPFSKKRSKKKMNKELDNCSPFLASQWKFSSLTRGAHFASTFHRIPMPPDNFFWE